MKIKLFSLTNQAVKIPICNIWIDKISLKKKKTTYDCFVAKKEFDFHLKN